MHADDGVLGGVVRTSARDGRVDVVGSAVERSVPACLKSNVLIVHGDEVEIANRTVVPCVRGVVVDLLADDVGGVYVEDMPL